MSNSNAWTLAVPGLDVSPRARLVIVIILGIFLSREATVGAAVSGAGTHAYSRVLTRHQRRPQHLNDEAVVAADGTTRGRLAEDVFTVAATTACELRRSSIVAIATLATAASWRVTSQRSRSTAGVLSDAHYSPITVLAGT
ncbi:hypothetical protein EDB84DRAFT_1584086 [Lactarius hengduanensis]|nr:hypothetical protein EDB84DRAFT_1584086 [Lactarius hengduanensis]